MRRREILGSLAAASVFALPRPLLAQRVPLRVAVVGGGIVGASIAMHLAEAGASVTLLEKAGPARGATEKSFAWLNIYNSDAHYRAVRLASLAAYRALDIPLGLGITWGGYLNWTDTAPESEAIRAFARAVAGSPQALRELSVEEFAQISPCIAPGSVASAYFSALDGHLDPVWVTYRFLDRARLLGARVTFPCEVTGLEFRRGRLTRVTTTQGKIKADRLVVAAGVDTPRILSMAGFPLRLKHAPGILAHSLPLPEVTKMVYDGPRGLEFKQMANGRIVGTDAPAPPDIPAHREIRERVSDFPDDATRSMHGRRVLDRIALYLPAAKSAILDYLTLGFRPMPLDEFPVVGAVPDSRDVYVAVTHSGVTLAPILGRYVSEELLGGRLVESLSPYRPARFGG
ncbi:MAG: FAD-binding oxidoreductase [Gammaproteobacteria bacterium]|nr:FAD-binding oxidoreductase [Gammaproteobacteria bacterium]